MPTFIIVDEAHNLIPSDPQGKAEAILLQQFGPLLDGRLLSECENKAVLRLGSNSVLRVTREMLGLEDIEMQLEKCLEFGKGLGLLVGDWTSGKPVLFFSAARRTVEGGKNLDANFWATPPVLSDRDNRKEE